MHPKPTMKLTLINISWNATSPVSPDAKVATCLGLETLEYRPFFTVSIWRYSKISYGRLMMDNASWDRKNFALPTGKKKTRFKETKEEAFLKTSTSHIYLVFSYNGLDKPSAQAA